MKTPLVTIITSCYNGEQFLSDYLDSIINQTYKNIELIIVNDGSTDKTEHIINSYKHICTDNQIILKNFYQENKGQAAAYNVALPQASGEYLMWSDADDVLSPNNISLKVDYLERNKDIMLVFGKARLIDENNNLKNVISFKKNEQNKNMFMNLINETNVAFFFTGTYMTRTDYFKKSNNGMHIYDGRGGQNWQMLLPIVYEGKCKYIDEVIYYYRQHFDSHSQKINSLDDWLTRYSQHEKILHNTIDHLKMSDKERIKWHKIINHKYYCRYIYLYSDYDNIPEARNHVKKLFANKLLYFKDIKVLVKAFFPNLHKQVKHLAKNCKKLKNFK